MDKFSHCDLHNETFRYTKGCYECALEEIDRLKSDLRDTSIALRTAIESIQAHKAEIAALENAEWLTTAHTICSDMGIPQGHIKDRMVALRDKLERYAGGVEVEGRMSASGQIVLGAKAADTMTMKFLHCQPVTVRVMRKEGEYEE